MNAIHERRLGARNYQVHTILLGKLDEAGVVIAFDVDVGDLAGNTSTSATVTGSDIDGIDSGGLTQFPGKGMFPSTVADHEDAQWFLGHVVQVSRADLGEL